MKISHQRPVRRRRRNDDGATLIIAMVVMLVMGVLVSSVAMYATTASRGVESYRVQRDERYAGDAAIKTAVNWASTQPDVGRDPSLGLSSTPCIMATTAVVDGESTPVKVSCGADAGGGSGQPAEVGLVPPEAIVLTSQRTKESGPYTARQCKGWWDTIAGWFTDDYAVGIDYGAGLAPETGAWFRPRSGYGTLSATCNNPFSRGWAGFKIRGSIAAASNVRVDNGTLNLIADVPGNDKVYANDNAGCVGVVCTPMANRTGYADELSYLNGTAKSSDPGRTNPAAPNVNAVGDIAAPFAPVGFNADGTPKSALTVRTTAYTWNSTTNVFTPITTCSGTSPTVVFLPGWYKSAEVISKYTGSSSASCKNATFWFAPDPGADGTLLTDDDRTGTFLLDFGNTPGAASTCGSNTVNSRVRWCIGAAADSNSRVVVGTPDGWTPQGVYTPGSGTAPPQTAVAITTAGTVDDDLSQSWFAGSASPATPSTDAASIDGAIARYTPTACFIVCFSSDRAIRVRDLTPKITAPPIEKSGAPRGRIYLEVAYGVQNPSSVEAMEAVVATVSPESGRHDCGTYTLYGNSGSAAPFNNKNNAAYSGSGALPATYKFTDAQAKQLADVCGTVDRINGLEIKLQVRGNTFNLPTAQWWLDGVKLSYDATRGANFPYPTNPGGTSSEDVKAKSDCDPEKPGGQLVFNGESHVVVNDGTLEVCAGPYRPTATAADEPDKHQQIGIWSMPSVAEVGPTGPATAGAANTQEIVNGSSVTAIDKLNVQIKYGTSSWGGDAEGQALVPMGGYTAPSGYRIAKVTARVGYNPKNQGCTGLFGCPGEAPKLKVGSCEFDYPKHADWDAQVTSLNEDRTTMYVEGGDDCLGISADGRSFSASTITWKARGGCFFGCNYNDSLDGIMYQVTLRAADTSAARLIPQTGCIVVHPNYNEGAGGPDCAIVRAVQSTGNDNFTFPWENPAAHSVGRVSVQGTIYAPSSAIEIDDTDVAYPLATRGIVARHLRVSGFAPRDNYDGFAVDTYVDRTPAPREALFTACVAIESDADEPCGDGDRILTRARVRYELATSEQEPDPEKRAKLPVIQWWSNDR